MKFCAKCGNGNDDDSKFCRKCGNTFGSSTGGDTIVGKPPPAPSPVSKPADTGTTSLDPNIAHFLCYIAGWVSGIVFLIMEKNDRATRFHAWQSIITLGGISIISILMYSLFSMLAAARLFGVGWFLGYLINALLLGVYIVGLVLWIVLMIKAFQGHDYQLPAVGAIAYNLAYKDQPAESQPKPQKTAPAAAKFDLPPAPLAKKAENKATITKFCISCGESLPQKAVFCSRCGEKQP